jgi:16S rRNA (guanine527-N7)-methyltransferase
LVLSEDVLSEERIAALVAPYLQELPAGLDVRAELYGQLRVYLGLLLRWNARTNLTAIREPAEMVRRHFGESLFAGSCLGTRVKAGAEVLDLGSGAGFPGVPVQLLLPEVRVTLAESQGKKAAFLREVVRILGLQCEVWAGRVESMAAERRFDAVMLRAVDRMEAMVDVGRSRVRDGGVLLQMGGGERDVDGGIRVWAMPGRDSWVSIRQL